MNTAVRVVSTNTNIFSRPIFVLPTLEVRVLALLFGVLFSALALIYVKDLGRRLFIDYQDLKQSSQVLNMQCDRLMLEESAFASPLRIEEIASQKLAMKLPAQEDMVLIEVS